MTSDKNFSLVNCNDSKNICFYNGKNEDLEGFIVSEINDKNGRKEFIIENKKNGNNRILISVYSKSDLFYGDYLYINCDLAFPNNSKNSKFNYIRYLQLKNVYSVCNNIKISKYENMKKFDLYYYILKLKYFVKNRVDEIYEKPYSGLIFGVLFGGNFLDKDLSNLFSKAGISHITAVSGYNVSIIVSILSGVFLKIGVNRFKIFYFLLIFLFLFVLFTGATASVIRAAIMGACSLMALQFGRISSGVLLLFFVGFVMVLSNPLILIYDVGFELSFLATFGILFFKPILDNVFIKFNNFLNIKDSFNTTISAFVCTFPVIFINFGSFNLLSIIINLLVLQYIPFLMFFGFVSIFLSKFVSFFAVFIMKYIIFICQVFT